MKQAFSLIEITIVLGILGIIGVISGFSLLKIYQHHTPIQKNIKHQLQTQNVLLQVKKILQNSIQPSLMLDTQESLSSSPLNLKNKTLIFYPKIREKISIGSYSIPCLHGFFDPKTLQINAHLSLEFLTIHRDSTASLNQKCTSYTHSLEALFVLQNFTAPKDFYSQEYKAKILHLDATSMQSTIPIFLQTHKNANLSLLPKIYFLSQPSMLHFNDSLSLVTKDKTYLLAKNLDSFYLSQNDLGIILKLCTNHQNQKICIEDFIAKETL
ncbi:hypothetical protein HPU229336_01740 [Helicobacter pullorum]|uniref:Prepilin-type N-terminal cleavage/methylation domain-containing protein n=1 Tax=Helicobacter pullorum TaxID=35818 RepID=A0AAW3J5Y9_9HELI|nr:type II secretion system protein [Helicobacter pullorum]KPH50642.1 hypothetical protein HPU229336_01740 [Helicobacter pullorum]